MLFAAELTAKTQPLVYALRNSLRLVQSMASDGMLRKDCQDFRNLCDPCAFAVKHAECLIRRRHELEDGPVDGVGLGQEHLCALRCRPRCDRGSVEALAAHVLRLDAIE